MRLRIILMFPKENDMAETSIVYDYEENQVRLWTDRVGVTNQIVKRSKGKATVTESKNGDRIVAWSITLPIELCRGAYTIAKILETASETESVNDGESDSDWSDRVEHGEYDPIAPLNAREIVSLRSGDRASPCKNCVLEPL